MPSVECLILRLRDLPPSANAIWRAAGARRKGGRGVLKSADYRAWIKAASVEIMAQAGNKFVTGPFAVAIQLIPPDRRRRDIDNRIKPLLDLLKETVTDDDGDCQKVSIEWRAPDGGPELTRIQILTTNRVNHG